MTLALGVVKFAGTNRAFDALEEYIETHPAESWPHHVAIIARHRLGRVSIFQHLDVDWELDDNMQPLDASAGAATGMLAGLIAGPIGMVAGTAIGAAIGGSRSHAEGARPRGRRHHAPPGARASAR